MTRHHASIVYRQALIGDLIADTLRADDWTTSLVPLNADIEVALQHLETEAPTLIALDFEPIYAEWLVRLVRAIRADAPLASSPILMSRYRGDSIAAVHRSAAGGRWGIMTRPYSVDDFLTVATYLVSERYRADTNDLEPPVARSIVRLGTA